METKLKNKQSQAKRIKILFKSMKSTFRSYEDMGNFKEPILILMRNTGKNEFYDNATAGKFTFTHSDGKERAIELAPEYLRTFDYGKRVFKGYICFPKETIILGEKSKKIEDINIGDLVLGDDGKLTKVIEVTKRKYSGDFIKIKARGMMEVKMTEEHPILVKKWRGKNLKSVKDSFKGVKEEWINAKNIRIGDLISIPRIKDYKFEDKSYKNLNGGKQPKEIKINLNLNKEFSYFLGLYTAEGSVCGNDIRLSMHLKEEYILRNIEEFLRKIGIKNTRYIKIGNCLTICFCCRELERYLKENCGEGAYNKHIPKEILYNKDLEILKEYIKGYGIGDGFYYKDKKRMQYASISDKMALELQLAYARFGKALNVYTYYHNKERKIKGKILPKERINQMMILDNLSYNLPRIEENRIWLRVREINKEFNEEEVYNLKTERKTYVANNLIVHNCDENRSVPLPESPLCTIEAYETGITKTLNDLSKWKAKEYKGIGEMWINIAIAIAIVGAVIIAIKMFLPNVHIPFLSSKEVTQTVVQNLSGLINP